MLMNHLLRKSEGACSISEIISVTCFPAIQQLVLAVHCLSPGRHIPAEIVPVVKQKENCATVLHALNCRLLKWTIHSTAQSLEIIHAD